jgi:hypothetical protein
MLAAHDLTTTTGAQLQMQLHTNVYSPDVDHAVIGDLTNEVVQAGNYVTGGESVTKGAMAPADDDGNDWAVFDITEDIVWAAATITAAFGVLLNDDHASDALICWFDFGGDKTSTADTYTLAFHATGLFTIA